MKVHGMLVVLTMKRFSQFPSACDNHAQSILNDTAVKMNQTELQQ